MFWRFTTPCHLEPIKTFPNCRIELNAGTLSKADRLRSTWIIVSSKRCDCRSWRRSWLVDSQWFSPFGCAFPLTFLWYCNQTWPRKIMEHLLGETSGNPWWNLRETNVFEAFPGILKGTMFCFGKEHHSLRAPLGLRFAWCCKISMGWQYFLTFCNYPSLEIGS